MRPFYYLSLSSSKMVANYLTFLLFAWAAVDLLSKTRCQGLTGCVKQADCGANQYCRMYDFTSDYPPMWPPCPHFGLCACVERSVMLGNGSCVPIVTLNLGDNCTKSVFERFVSPDTMHCGDNKRVVCNWPFSADDSGQRCVTTTQAVPTTTVSVGPPVFHDAPSASLGIYNATYAPYLATCNPSQRLLCDQSQQGLCCLMRGTNSSYMQCLCCDPHQSFDVTSSRCRPRVYGDLCINDEDCNSGLISSSGFECRLGRCRCTDGYVAVDNLYWNETGKTTYLRRICVIAGATVQVPTGQECTMNPEIWSQYNSTRICHRRAFCHQCFRERISYSQVHQQTIGVCREMSCLSDGDCQASMKCNKWGAMIDPPCDRGMCDCNSSGSFYLDRYSRCSPYRTLQLGDRCLLKSPHGLQPWYLTNEDWDDRKDCIEGGKALSSGLRLGILKCAAPVYEDVDGACVANNDMSSGSLFVKRSFGEACDDDDARLPRVICDADKKLACFNRKCVCETDTSLPNYVLWDGNTCRLRTFGDSCKTDADCLTGTFYAPAVVGARCENSLCTCADGFTEADVNSVEFDNGAYTKNLKKSKYCFPGNVTIVSKGGSCHLDPIALAEEGLRLSDITDTIIQPNVCDAKSGLYCIRCPADFNPDDESLGICRSFQQLSFSGPQPSTTVCTPRNVNLEANLQSLASSNSNNNNNNNLAASSSSVSKPTPASQMQKCRANALLPQSNAIRLALLLTWSLIMLCFFFPS